LSSVEEIEAYIESVGEPEADDAVCQCGGPVLTAEKDFTGATESYQVIWEDEHDTPAEYAVYGWIKQNNLVAGSDE
jgi:hypothetical protein